MDATIDLPRGLAATLRALDWSMLLYWAAMALACAGILMLPANAMYEGYGLPLIDAWNWSFAPLDLAFAITGLASLKLAARGDRRWLPLVLVSLTLTFCAGLMAVSFWALQGTFDLAWWLPNLLLIACAIYWVPRLVLRSSDE
jgi:hypothetical protein